jgi:hypothetical protein
LEVAVVANFLIDLQTVPHTVGDNDVIGFGIELYRRWEAKAPLRF